MDTGDDAANEAIKQAQGFLRAFVQEIRRRAWMGGMNVDKGKVDSAADGILSRLMANEAAEIKLTAKYEREPKDATMPKTAKEVLAGRTLYCATLAERNALDQRLRAAGIETFADPADADSRIEKVKLGESARGLLPERESGAYRIWTAQPLGEWADQELAREVATAHSAKALASDMALRKAERELPKPPSQPELVKGAWANPTFTVKTLSFDPQAAFWDEHLAERGIPFAKTVMDGAMRYEIAPESARDVKAMLDDLEGITGNKREDRRVSVDAVFEKALEPSADRANVREVSKIDMKRGNELENVATMEALNEAGIDYDVSFDSELNVDSFVMDGNARGTLLSMDDDQVDALFQSENVVTSVNQAAKAAGKGQKAAASRSASKPMKERQFKLHAAEDLGREQAREHARQDQARAQQLARESRDRGMRPERSETRAR